MADEYICHKYEFAGQSGHLRDLKESIDKMIAEHGEWTEYVLCCDVYGYLPDIDIELYKKEKQQ